MYERTVGPVRAWATAEIAQLQRGMPLPGWPLAIAVAVYPGGAGRPRRCRSAPW